VEDNEWSKYCHTCYLLWVFKTIQRETDDRSDPRYDLSNIMKFDKRCFLHDKQEGRGVEVKDLRSYDFTQASSLMNTMTKSFLKTLIPHGTERLCTAACQWNRCNETFP